METVNAVGRRKAAIARVIVKEGNGTITINKRPIDVYFPSSILQYIVKQPMLTLDCVEKYDIKVNLDGGGYKGQAEALRLAIARALVLIWMVWDCVSMMNPSGARTSVTTTLFPGFSPEIRTSPFSSLR